MFCRIRKFEAEFYEDVPEMNMNRNFMTIGAVAGAIGVGLGAFGAHSLSDLLAPDRFEVYQTGVEYLTLHAIMLFITGWVNHLSNERMFMYSGFGFILGMILFSGSLVVLAVANVRIMGAVAPIGGLCFIFGWLLLGWGAFRSIR